MVDGDAFTVELHGDAVDLEPQAMDVLLYMLERRDQLLTKEVLLDDVWGDQFVGESALTTRIKQLRRALGDDGRSQRVIRTVHGKGYRFVAPVEEIARSTIDDARPSAPAPHDEPRHNIPPSRTRLIGRRAILDTTRAALDASRLVTLVGFGGAGKTSVAAEVGRRVAPEFPGGVWFVDLISAHDAAGIDRAVARAIGVQLGADSDRAALLRHLRDRAVLLVLDNCEHVADEAADFCSAVLDATTSPRLLATSRVPLHVIGEHRIAVGPLPLIDDDGGALDLLDDVASRAGASIAPADRIAALDLCRRVDGLPLAVELVGARLTTMSVREIVDRLEQLGEAAAHDRRPERHAALATVLSDTVGTLDAEGVRLLTVLSRLEGSFGIDEVEGLARVAGIDRPTERFGELIDRSLLVSTTTSPRRHAVLETVRQHAAGTDADPGTTADDHARWCLDALGTSLRTSFYDLRRADWVADRYDDIMVAHDHLAAERRDDEAIAVLAATALAMHLNDGSRAADMLRRLDQHRPSDDARLAARQHCAGVMAAMAARVPTAMHERGIAAVEAADATDDRSLRGLARVMRSWAGVVIDVEQALADLDDAIALASEAADVDTELIAVGYKVFHLAMGLRFDEAVRVGHDALDRVPPDASSYPRRVAATGLICCLVVDDPEAAIRLDDEVRTEMSATFWGTNIVRAAAHAALGDADTVAASVRLLEERLDRSGISPLPDLLLVPAALAHARGDTDRAGRYLGAVRAADRPTQSLMVSTAYRVLRNHVDVIAPDADTGAVWAEARSWLATV